MEHVALARNGATAQAAARLLRGVERSATAIAARTTRAPANQPSVLTSRCTRQVSGIWQCRAQKRRNWNTL